MTLEQDMLQALERHQFVLYYQPIVDLRESRIAGFEALLRWQHPELGLLPPAEFIPIAEETGAIRSIGRWVLHTACAEAARWPAGLSVAVNLSPAQFKSGVLDAEIEDALRLSGLPPARLDLEVTEGLLLEDTEQVVSTMAALRAQGVRLVMDDFGTAHAGLTYLRRFPFDQIKIDRGFTQAIGVDRHASAIVEIVLMLGHTLGLEVVAEGVETEEQAATLKRLGCRFAQGYLLGRPGPAVRW